MGHETHQQTSNRRSDLVEWLATEICHGRLPAGTVLHQEDLADQRQVARSVVREACGVLASLGMVASKRRAGTTVLPMSAWELLSSDVIRWRMASPEQATQIIELSQLRSAIEPQAAGLAARLAAEEDRREVVEIADRLCSAGERGDLAGFHVLDKQLHTLVMSMGGNRLFAQLHAVVVELLEGRYRHGLMPTAIAPRTLTWHSDLARAIARSDESAAMASAQLIVRASAQEMLALAAAVKKA